MAGQQRQTNVDIIASIHKGEKQQMVAAIDKFLGLWEDSKIAYRRTVPSELVG